MPQGIAVSDTNQVCCAKCHKTMNSSNFYQYKDGSKCELCKACLTLHINNFEPDTFLWLLEKFDIPYIEEEWNVLRDRAYAKDPYKMNGMSVFGRYLSKMKLKQFKDYSWADTEMLKERAAQNAQKYGLPEEQAEAQLQSIKEAYENGEITEAQYQTYTETHAPEPAFTKDPPRSEISAGGGNNFAYPANGDFAEVNLPTIELTEEEKQIYALKWGRLYRVDEWIALEQEYTGFMESFDIQGEARIATLKMICKTLLKMNQALDCGDVDTYQKLSRVYDAMMKAAKFTEAQNKEGKSDFLDSVGEIVDYCEKYGGQIPEFEIVAPLDVVDKVIDDLKTYNKTLIYEDKSLAEEIEQYLKKREALDQAKRDKEEAKAKGLDYVELSDQDYVDYKERIEAEREEDQKIYYDEVEEEE